MSFDLEKAEAVCKTLPKYMNGACPCKEEAEAAKMLIKALPEIRRLRAKVGKMEFLMRSTDDTCLACAIKLEVIDQQAARIQELEAALVEAKAAIKFCLDEGDEDENYGPMHDLPEWRELPEKDKDVFRDWCRTLLQAEGKIGPDADECPDDLPPIGSPYRSWQITDERIRAIQWAEEMAGDCKAGDVLRAMLTEAEQ